MSSLVSIKDLMKVTGYKSAGHIESWLQKNHIPYFQGKKGRIFTTTTKLNESLDGEKKQMKPIEFGHGPKA